MNTLFRALRRWYGIKHHTPIELVKLPDGTFVVRQGKQYRDLEDTHWWTKGEHVSRWCATDNVQQAEELFLKLYSRNDLVIIEKEDIILSSVDILKEKKQDD